MNASLALEARRVPAAEWGVENRLVELMSEFERPIFNFLLSLLHDADLASDCAQDTFMRAYENLRRDRPVNSAWLYTVARNRAMDEFRRRRRIEPENEQLDTIPVHDRTDSVLAVRQALDRLSPQDREVLYLFDVAGFRTEEIGRMLGASGAAIRQRLSRARERFRRVYGVEA